MSAHLQTAYPMDETIRLRWRPARLAERLAAFILLAALAPFVALIAAAIVVETGFPVFFSQTRLGRHGHPFRLHKFRKFGPNEGINTRPVTLAHDKRLTGVGAVLEQTKLDELPQLWNVAKGEMSFVGPRPETPNFADCFAGEYRRVLDHRPGILGPSQAMFRNEGALYPADTDPEQYYREVLFPTKAAIDLEYYPRRTFARDAAWVLRSIVAVIWPRAALGIPVGDDQGRTVGELAVAGDVRPDSTFVE